MNSRGLLVAFEGIDATGKSTLAPMVSKLLQSQYSLKSAFVEEFPADYLGGYLSDLMAVDPLLRLHDSTPTPVTQTLVLIGAHVYKYETQLTYALASNQIVCVERYTASILAYQPVFLAPEMSRSLAELEAWISSVLSFVPPADINVLLTAEPQVIADRIRARDEWDEENMKLLEVIAQRYRRLAAHSANWTIFNSADDGPDETAQRIASFISERVADRRSSPHGE
jgi:thymidylate kinase